MKRGTPDHPKTKRLRRALSLNRYETAGLLECLWHLTALYCKRGDIGKWTNEEIAIELEWGGNADDLIRTLITCGFIDACVNHRLVIHDWEDHADQTVKRSETIKAHGFASVTPPDTSENYDQLGDDSPPMPMPTPCAQPEPEPVAQQEPAACSEPSETDNSKPDDPVILTFPTRGEKKTWDFCASKLKQYEGNYPGMDIKQEARKALQWCHDNSEKQKTARGMTKFLGGWLSRVNNQGERYGHGQTAYANQNQQNPSRVAAKPGKYAGVGAIIKDDANRTTG